MILQSNSLSGSRELFTNLNKFIIIMMLCGSLVVSQQVAGQNNESPVILLPTDVTPNRILPSGILPTDKPIPVHFSKIPTDEEIFQTHFFEEPLIPSSHVLLPDENRLLVFSLAAFSQRTSADDFSAVLNFLNNYPTSRWTGGLLADLGLAYRRSGYFNLAMQAWQKSWQLMKKLTDHQAKILADRVATELLMEYSWVGRQQAMDSLITELNGRTVEGPAVERLVSVKEGLWLMKTNPGISFKCGPLALNKLYYLQDSLHRSNQKLLEIQSSPKGFSLFDLYQMANDIGLKYQMAFRNPGAPVIINSVVHWRLEHYSALTGVDNGNYRCEDATSSATYGQEFWLTENALDVSASGYFLVPAGILPAGWRPVSESEASGIFGKGQRPSDDKGKNTKDCDPHVPQCPTCDSKTPMAKPSMHTVAISLQIADRPAFSLPPVGPAMLFDVLYHQRDSYQPANFSYSNLGQKWTFGYLSYVQDNPNNPAASADVYIRGGGVETFTYNSSSKSYDPELRSKDKLIRVCSNCYQLLHPDGSREIYERADGSNVSGRKVFLTRIEDGLGNQLLVKYDSLLRVVALQDRISQVTNILYEEASDKYKITKVIIPDGRFAKFEYKNGLLFKITDMIGIQSQFHYLGADFIDTLQTNYGITTFVKEENKTNNDRALEIRYPTGQRERIEFKERAPGIAGSESILPANSAIRVTNSYMEWRNTFYWNALAMQQFPGDYTKAKIFHWVHGSAFTGEDASISAILESEKSPNENRVFYNYQNQGDPIYAVANMSSRPSVIARVLDDGTTQASKFTYNTIGNATSYTDELNRTRQMKYDSTGIDLLEVRQVNGKTTDLLSSFVYNSKHLPIKYVDQSGMTWLMEYNDFGQVTKLTNPKKEIAQYNYSREGYLTSLVGPTGARDSLAFDSSGRINKVISKEGYITKITYDQIDRPLVITFPDNTYQQYQYDKLDAVGFRDRNGKWTYTKYDSLRHPIEFVDQLQRKTIVKWCKCGGIDQFIAPGNQVTSFTRDLAGRIIAKSNPDGSIDSTIFEKTIGRIAYTVDGVKQKKLIKYNADNSIREIHYQNAAVPTGAVYLSYDPVYPRPVSVQDTTGKTTYKYVPVLSNPIAGTGMLASVEGPLPNSKIELSYDSASRPESRTINGVTAKLVYDAMGHVTSETNVLGTFNYVFVPQSDHLLSVRYPNQTQTDFGYYDNQHDQLLSKIVHRTAGGGGYLSFQFAYNALQMITNTAKTANGQVAEIRDVNYTETNELAGVHARVSSSLIQGTVGDVSDEYYRTDSSYNIISEHSAMGTLENTFNVNNQLISQRNIDSLLGRQPEIGFTYNKVGDMITSRNSVRSYSWDAEHNLVKMTDNGDLVEFIYDAFRHRVAEKINGRIVKRWLWSGPELLEERDSSGANVIKRFLLQGEEVNGVPYYYLRDNLASVRGVTDSTGKLVATYDYSSFGQMRKKSGFFDADFGFAGLYIDKSTGLYLTQFRPYDAKLHRWLSRDPMGINEGANAYAYVSNDPLNFTDPLGLAECNCHSTNPLDLADLGKKANDVIGTGLGGYETARFATLLPGITDKIGWWVDKQGVFRSLKTPGNGTTGGKLKYGEASIKSVHLLAKVSFGITAAFSVFNAGMAYYNNDCNKNQIGKKAAEDLFFGALAFAGPIGWAISATYLAGDYFGWNEKLGL